MTTQESEYGKEMWRCHGGLGSNAEATMGRLASGGLALHWRAEGLGPETDVDYAGTLMLPSGLEMSTLSGGLRWTSS